MSTPSLIAAIKATAASPASQPTFPGTVPITAVDRRRADSMSEDRRLFNEEDDDPWGHREDCHRGRSHAEKTWTLIAGMSDCIDASALAKVRNEVGLDILAREC